MTQGLAASPATEQPPPPPPPPPAAAPSPLKQRLWMAFHGQQQQKKLVQQNQQQQQTQQAGLRNPTKQPEEKQETKTKLKGWRGRVLKSSSSSPGSSASSAKKMSGSPGETSTSIKGTAFVGEVDDAVDVETATAALDTSEDNGSADMPPQEDSLTHSSPVISVHPNTTTVDQYTIRGAYSGNNSVFISVPSDTEESSYSATDTRSFASLPAHDDGLYMLPKAEFDDHEQDNEDDDELYGFGLGDADDFFDGKDGLDIMNAMDDLPAFDDDIDDNLEMGSKSKDASTKEQDKLPGLVPALSQEEDEDYNYDASDDGKSPKTTKKAQPSSRAGTSISASTASSSFMVMTPLLNEEDGKPNHLLLDRPPTPPTPEDSPAKQAQGMVQNAAVEVQRYTSAADQHLAHGRYKEAQEEYQKILGVARDVIESFPEDFDATSNPPRSPDLGGRNQDLGTKQWQWHTVQRHYLVIADALNNMGVAHEMVANYDGGIKCAKEALAVYEKVSKATLDEQARRRRRRRRSSRRRSEVEEATDQGRKTPAYLQGEDESNHTSSTGVSTSFSEDDEDQDVLADLLQAIQSNIQRTKTNLSQMARGRTSYPERSRLHSLASEYAASSHSNDTGEAVTLYRKVLTLERATLGRSHPQVGRTLVALAAVEDARGNAEVAQEHFNVAFFLLRSALGEFHPDLASAYVAIASMHDRGGEHEEALRAYQAALGIQRRALGEDHVEIASTWNNVGVQHFALGKYGEALRAYQRAIEVYGVGKDEAYKTHGKKKKHCPEVALLWNNVGEVHRAKRNHTEAMEAYQTALGMFRSSLPHDGHEYVITTLLNMGVVRARNGDYDGAMAAYAEALKAQRLAAVYQGTAGNTGTSSSKGSIRLPGVSGRSADVAVTLKSMGVLHERRGDITSALRCYEEALRLRRESLGHDHVDNARLLTAMGSAQDRRGDAASAVAYHSEAVRIYKKHGYYNRNTGNRSNHKNKNQEDSPSKGQDAAKLAKEKLRRAKMTVAVQAASSAPSHSPDSWQQFHRGTASGGGVAPFLDATAHDFAAKGRHEESLSYLADALHTRRCAMGEEHVDVAKAMVKVAHAYQKRGGTAKVSSSSASCSQASWASACYTGGNEEAMTMYTEALRIYRLNGLEYQHPFVREVVREMHCIRENTCSSWTRQF